MVKLRSVIPWPALALRSILWILLLTLSLQSSAQVDHEPRYLGTIDSVYYEDTSKRIELRGWAVDLESNAVLLSIEAVVNGETVVSSALTLANRPDVKAAHHTASERVGFIAHGTLTSTLSGGLHDVRVTARFSDGHQLELQNWSGRTPQLHVTKARARHWGLLFIVCAFIGLAHLRTVRYGAERLALWIDKRYRWIAWGLVATFVALVTAGITGSSLALLTGSDYGEAVTEVRGSGGRLFRLQSIRADEWGVLTPNALAQYHHSPPFPIVNRNLGLEGQNMGVIGMTGSPIAQPAAIARPATWGYFVLPLRQALSWQWQLPFFACFLGLWAVLNVMRPQRRATNLALTASFCLAPYAAAWSNWPLYAACFPLLGIAVFYLLLRPHRTAHALALGVALSVLLTSWILVLYPPWQITVGTFCGLLVIGIWLDQKKKFHFGKKQWIALGVTAMLSSLLLYSWWLDTGGAVAQMRATVYPGARNALQGAEIGHLWSLRGYMNTETLPFGTGPESNASEASSYFFLPLVMLWLGLRHVRSKGPNRWAIAACVLFILFWMVFRFIGIPLWLAKITLWSNVPSGRIDLSLGLACTVLLALVAFGGGKNEGGLHPRTPWAIAALLTISSGALIYYGLYSMPKEIFPKNSLPFMAAIVISGAAMAWWLVRGRTDAAILLGLVLAIISTVGFNPVSRAPRKIELAPAAAQFAAQAPGDDRLARTLVIGGGMSAMAFAAVGIPVVNAVLYYPHRTLWQQMELPKEEWPKVNRYQHLAFNLANIPSGRPYRVSNGLDHINVEVDPRRFNFSSTGADRVAALEAEANHLRENSMLQELGMDNGLVWFAVQRQRRGD